MIEVRGGLVAMAPARLRDEALLYMKQSRAPFLLVNSETLFHFIKNVRFLV